MVYLTIINVVLAVTLIWTSEGQRRERRQWAVASREERRELLTRVTHPNLVPVAPIAPTQESPVDEDFKAEIEIQDELGLVGTISHGGSE